MRAQGRRTRRRLSDAALRVFARRGFHQARVDDIVRAARTSHGTFYLYFANKEDLLRSLAADCAAAFAELAARVPEVPADRDGNALRAFVDEYLAVSVRYGVVIRVWTERQVEDRTVDRLGVTAFTDLAAAFGARLRAAGAAHDEATVAALLALLERTGYAVASRDLGVDRDAVVATLTTVVRRGFFTAA
jgi:AcrR family transcriptional regulator